MDHNSIIDRNSFEVYTHSEDYPKAFICDKLLAPAVATLNKKGYKTFASCQGHYKVEFYEYFDEDISLLEKLRKDDHVIIKKIKENSVDYWYEVKHTEIYILFDKKYDFDILPDGFNLEDSSDRTNIYHDISYYDENNIKRKRQDVEEEREKYCKILNKWADNLPYKKGKINYE